MHTMSFVKPMYANAQRKKTTTNSAASWVEVSREVLAILVDSARKASSKDTGSTEWGCRWKDRKGKDTEKPVEVPSRISSSAATREEKTQGTAKQQSLINWLEKPQRKGSLAL